MKIAAIVLAGLALTVSAHAQAPTVSTSVTVNTERPGLISRMNKKKRAKEVGRLISAGDCKGAVDRALASGDIDLAQQARNLCVPATAQK